MPWARRVMAPDRYRWCLANCDNSAGEENRWPRLSAMRGCKPSSYVLSTRWHGGSRFGTPLASCLPPRAPRRKAWPKSKLLPRCSGGSTSTCASDRTAPSGTIICCSIKWPIWLAASPNPGQFTRPRSRFTNRAVPASPIRTSPRSGGSWRGAPRSAGCRASVAGDSAVYVESAPIVALQTSLHSWAAEAVDPQTLLADLERYEQTDTSTDARQLADDCRHLSWSPDPAVRRLGAVVDEHYRNANVRLAVSAAFLNRFVPQPAAQVAPFRDVIVGADVTGRSTTMTKLTVLLVPDPQRLRLGLEAHGVVTLEHGRHQWPGHVL